MGVEESEESWMRQQLMTEQEKGVGKGECESSGSIMEALTDSLLLTEGWRQYVGME